MTTNTKPAQCRFDELKDGELFRLTLAYGYESSRLLQRVIEHERYNALWVECPARGELIPGHVLVVRVNDVSKPDSGSFIPTVVAESSKHTLVLLNTNNYAFKDVELQGNEWIDLQDSYGTWNFMPVCATGINIAVDALGKYCFVFFDEADQCSQPYPTVQEAMDARKHYMENL